MHHKPSVLSADSYSEHAFFVKQCSLVYFCANTHAQQRISYCPTRGSPMQVSVRRTAFHDLGSHTFAGQCLSHSPPLLTPFAGINVHRT
eukprot:834171-Pelagomonas_calceolata.AAC.2